jgi:hypothetical protein
VKVHIHEFYQIICPSNNDEKREELNSIIKKYGKWDEMSELDIYFLGRKLNKEEWSKDLIKRIKEFQNIEKMERIYLSKIKRKIDILF